MHGFTTNVREIILLVLTVFPNDSHQNFWRSVLDFSSQIFECFWILPAYILAFRSDLDLCRLRA